MFRPLFRRILPLLSATFVLAVALPATFADPTTPAPADTTSKDPPKPTAENDEGDSEINLIESAPTPQTEALLAEEIRRAKLNYDRYSDQVVREAEDRQRLDAWIAE